MEACRWCCQVLMVPGYCGCRNYRVWPVDGKEENAKSVTGTNHGHAATYYADRYLDTPDDGDEHELYVKNASGDLKRVNVAACVSIDWDYQIHDEVEDERAG